MKYIVSVSFLLIFGLVSCKKDTLSPIHLTKIATHTTNTLHAAQLLNDSEMIVVGGDRFLSSCILRSKDSGYTYQLATTNNIPKAIYGVSKGFNNCIWAMAFDAKLVKSYDHVHWNYLQINNWQAYKKVIQLKSNLLLAIGGVSFDQGIISTIDTNGAITKNTLYNFECNELKDLGDGNLLVAGYGVFMKSGDYGQTWETQSIKNDNFKSICALNENEYFTCGYNGSIYHTSDGGNHWECLRNGNDLSLKSYHLLAIYFTNSKKGYTVGEDGIALYTSDGGHTWNPIDSFPKNTFRFISPCSNGDLLIGGDYGTLYRMQQF
jgi:photosystem II stability/assembly factor-like uncharacterized protein